MEEVASKKLEEVTPKKRVFHCRHLKDDPENNPTKLLSGDIEATRYEKDGNKNVIVFYDDTIELNMVGKPAKDNTEKIVANLRDIESWEITE